METFSALLAICAENSLVTGEFPAQRPVTGSFDVSFDLLPSKWVSKQLWGWWFETPSCQLWRHCNDAHLAPPWRTHHVTCKSTLICGLLERFHCIHRYFFSIAGHWHHNRSTPGTHRRRCSGARGTPQKGHYCTPRTLRSVSIWKWKLTTHDDVRLWECFPHYWPFVRGIHRRPMDSPHKGPVMCNLDVLFVIVGRDFCSKCAWLLHPKFRSISK